MRIWASWALLLTNVDALGAAELELNNDFAYRQPEFGERPYPGANLPYPEGRRPPIYEGRTRPGFSPGLNPGLNPGLRPGAGGVYQPIVLPLVDVTRYWRLWGLQQSLCDTVTGTLEENNIKELTSNQATLIGRAMERSHQVYTDYHHNMLPELASERDHMAVEARLWLGHDQFDHDLYNCWSNLQFGSPGGGMPPPGSPLPGDLGMQIYESLHESLARSLCLPFDSYVACRELLQLPKNSMRRFRDQIKVMKEEASMILRRMGRPTRYNYNRNQYYYQNDPYAWADDAASYVHHAGLAAVLWLTMYS